MDYKFLEENRIVPVVVIKDINDTLLTLDALYNGGIRVAEITFRTACAKEAIALASKNRKDMLIGAGTVINAKQCEQAIEAGAKFIVSPGFSKDVLDVCNKYSVTYLPGVVTPTEIMLAKSFGLTVLKFFPAGAYGGVKTLKALSAAFPDIRFLPTGGVDVESAEEYLSKPFVAAVGGSWMMKGDFKDIERLSREAVERLIK